MSIESVRVCLGSSLRARDAVRLRLRHLRQPSCFHSDVPIDWRLDIARNRHYWQLCGRQQHRWVAEPSPTDYVRRLLQSPALIGRLGGTEARCAVVVNEGELTRTGHRVSDCRAELSRQSGVRLSLSRYNLSDFIAIYVDAIRDADWLQFTCLHCSPSQVSQSGIVRVQRLHQPTHLALQVEAERASRTKATRRMT